MTATVIERSSFDSEAPDWQVFALQEHNRRRRDPSATGQEPTSDYIPAPQEDGCFAKAKGWFLEDDGAGGLSWLRPVPRCRGLVGWSPGAVCRWGGASPRPGPHGASPPRQHVPPGASLVPREVAADAWSFLGGLEYLARRPLGGWGPRRPRGCVPFGGSRGLRGGPKESIWSGRLIFLTIYISMRLLDSWQRNRKGSEVRSERASAEKRLGNLPQMLDQNGRILGCRSPPRCKRRLGIFF